MNAVRESRLCEYTVKNYESDFRKEIKPSALLGYFQEIAGEHAGEIGLGFQALREKGYFWVLSKIYVEVLSRPKFEDRVVVETWPHAPNKAIFERSFRVFGADGQVGVRAFSRWCVLEVGRERIVPSSRLESSLKTYRAEPAVAWDDWRIPEASGKGVPAFSLRIANSEYDLNYHVNNCKYADYVFNCFTVAELEARRLRSFQMNYVHQSHEGDCLDFYRSGDGEGGFVIEGIKNGAETVVAARVRFDD